MRVESITKLLLRLDLLLVFFVAFMTIGIITTYVIAVSEDHVKAVWPYISDTGNFSPERFMVISLIHYKHVMVVLMEDRAYYKCYVGLNRLAFSGALLCAFGLMLVGSFQDGSSLRDVHMVGADLLFIGGTIYCIVVTLIGHHIAIIHNLSLIKTFFRCCICATLILFVTIHIAALVVASHQRSNDKDHPSRFKWDSTDKGYAAHLTSSISEWLLVGLLFGFFLTFIGEFRVIKFSTTVSLREHHGYAAINGGDN